MDQQKPTAPKTVEEWLVKYRTQENLRKVIHKAYLDWCEHYVIAPHGGLEVPLDVMNEVAEDFVSGIGAKVLSYLVQSMGLQMPLKGDRVERDETAEPDSD